MNNISYEKIKEKTLVFTKTPLPGYTFTNVLQLLAQNNFFVSPRYIPRFLYTQVLISIMTPYRIKERIKFDKKINSTEIKHDPIFLIGFWRSGTTYLHNILSNDKSFAYFTTFQAYLPGVFLSSEKRWKPIVASSIPKKRPMDDVDMNADFSQEDQYAIGAFSKYSYYHGWCFPKKMEFYNKFVLMEDVTQNDIEKWKEIYLYLLKKITLYNNGKRLLLKNQDNTAKIKLLLEIFPNAKFVFMKRNPYDLYCSMMKFMSIVIPLCCIQTPPEIEQVEESMINLYIKMFSKYIKERELIPTGNLVEIKYEDFIKESLKEVKKNL
ncbi:MAG: sulfotransferase [Candidatus Thermoplasmatota archaeon]|nr:sulfotransferase [Candidatus Thermoplasmatota archaeon]